MTTQPTGASETRIRETDERQNTALEAKAHKATIRGVIVSVIAIVVACFTYVRSADLQKEVTAYTLYREHLQLCFSEPQFASGINVDVDDEKYGWFVANALHSAEAVHKLHPRDKPWRETVKEVIRTHE